MNTTKAIQSKQNLAKRAFSGGAWLGVGSSAEHGARFVRNIILTRILAPEAFGLMAIILSVCALSQVLTSIGVKEAVVQNPKGTERTYLNGAWWLSLARSTILFLVVYAVAPLIAGFYEQPELAGLLRVAFVSVLVSGAFSPRAFVALKTMQYRRWALIQNGGAVIGIATTIALGLVLQGVWALVLGYATEGVARCLLSHLLCPFRPGLRFDPEHLAALFGYARNIFGLPALMLIYAESSTFVAGKLCTKEQLGLYAMALTLARMPTMLGAMMVDLLMPIFSEIQRDNGRINRGLLRITSLMGLVGLPALLFIVFFGREVLTLAYGARYGVVSLVFAILFANELLVALNIPLSSVYLAIGAPKLLRRFSCIRALVVLVLVYPAIAHFGLTGAALVPLIGMLVSFAFQLTRLKEVIGFDLAAYGRTLARRGWLLLPMFPAWLLIKRYEWWLPPAASLALALIAGAGIALALENLFQRRKGTDPLLLKPG